MTSYRGDVRSEFLLPGDVSSRLTGRKNANWWINAGFYEDPGDGGLTVS